MRRIFEKLYYGEIRTFEKPASDTEDFKKLDGEYQKQFDHIVDLMESRGIVRSHILLEDMVIAWFKVLRYEQIDIFQEGIKLGLAFGLLLQEEIE